MTKWALDTAHSEVGFKVKHLMISTVNGNFGSFRADLSSDEGFKNASLIFSIDTASINTGNEQRDGHLQSDDFFNAEKFPTITFKLENITPKNEDTFEYSGALTIRDITLPTTFNVSYNGMMTDPYGQVKAGFEVTGKVSRKAFGLLWNATTETGGVVVSDEVKVSCNLQFIRQS